MTDGPREDRWRVRGVRSIYESKWVSLGLADVELPSGQRFEHHTVSMPGAAMAVVIDDEREHVLLSWRHRFVADVWNYELPGGLVEKDEAPAATVEREILEETGYRPRTLRHVVTFEPMIGMLHSPHHVFIAEGAERVAEPAELDEGHFEWIPLTEVPTLLREQKVSNSGTLIGLLSYLALTPGADPQ